MHPEASGPHTVTFRLGIHLPGGSGGAGGSGAYGGAGG